MALSVAKFRAYAKKVFQIAGDVVQPVTYKHVVPGVYDPATGTAATTETTYTPKALLVGLDDREQTWFPADADVQKAIIPYSELSITPSSQDYFVIDGVRWEIMRITTPPTAAIRKFYIQS